MNLLFFVYEIFIIMKTEFVLPKLSISTRKYVLCCHEFWLGAMKYRLSIVSILHLPTSSNLKRVWEIIQLKWLIAHTTVQAYYIFIYCNMQTVCDDNVNTHKNKTNETGKNVSYKMKIY